MLEKVAQMNISKSFASHKILCFWCVLCLATLLPFQRALSQQSDELTTLYCQGIAAPPDEFGDGRPRARFKGPLLTGNHEEKYIGGVRLQFGGYTVCADQITHNEATGETRATGSVFMREPDGTVTLGEEIVFNEKWRKAYSDARKAIKSEFPDELAARVKKTQEIADDERRSNPTQVMVDLASLKPFDLHVGLLFEGDRNNCPSRTAFLVVNGRGLRFKFPTLDRKISDYTMQINEIDRPGVLSFLSPDCEIDITATRKIRVSQEWDGTGRSEQLPACSEAKYWEKCEAERDQFTGRLVGILASESDDELIASAKMKYFGSTAYWAGGGVGAGGKNEPLKEEECFEISGFATISERGLELLFHPASFAKNEPLFLRKIVSPGEPQKLEFFNGKCSILLTIERKVRLGGHWLNSRPSRIPLPKAE